MQYHHTNKVTCDLCGNEKSISNYSKHRKICKGKPQLPNYRLLDYPLSFDKKMFHVIYRTDCFIEPMGEQEFLANWDIYNNIHAYCGSHKVSSVEIDSKNIFNNTTSHPHAHFIGIWANTSRVKDNKYLAKFFTTRNSYRCINLLKEKEDGTSQPYNFHFRILQTIYYIQTVNGKHPKTHHMNPITFANEYYRKKYIKNLSTRELWIIEQYRIFLASLLNKLEHLRLAIAQDPVTFPPSMLHHGRIKLINYKIEHANKIITNILGHEDVVSHEDLMFSYNNYINN